MLFGRVLQGWNPKRLVTPSPVNVVTYTLKTSCMLSIQTLQTLGMQTRRNETHKHSIRKVDKAGNFKLRNIP